MITNSNFIDVHTAGAYGLSLPKVIAKITICGAVKLDIYDCMDWNSPTPEQIKNLKEILNIDVKLIGEDDDEEK